MASTDKSMTGQPAPLDPGEGLRQAIFRLVGARFEALQNEIFLLDEQVQSLTLLRTTLQNVEQHLALRDDMLQQQDAELQETILQAQDQIAALQAEIAQLNDTLKQETALLAALETRLNDPAEISGRITPLLIPVTHEQVRSQGEAYAEALAPVMGPAIRHQIRTARQDIVDALYPLIGQMIGKALSEAIRELTQKIDSRLQSQFNLRSRWRYLVARSQGVSGPDLALRESLPYSLAHIFLIHRESGLLLRHLGLVEGQVDDSDLIGSMLSAIRDFVRDSFGENQGELEEIDYGDQRILLESGYYAYLAVVLEGVEPAGYTTLMRSVIEEINLDDEAALRSFTGDMDSLPDFKPALDRLASPAEIETGSSSTSAPMSRGEKWAIAGGITAILIVIGMAIFACIFTIRLWPLAFPGPLPTSTATAAIATQAPPQTPTATLQPTATLIPTWTASPTATLPPTLAPTSTPTITPTARPLASLTGNLRVRQDPSPTGEILGTLLTGEKVLILDRQGNWYYIAWPVDAPPTLQGWVWSQFVSAEN